MPCKPAAASRQAAGQAGAVVAQVQQGQRDALSFPDAQAQPEFAGLGVLDGVGRAFLDQPVDGGAGVVIQQARVAVQFRVVASCPRC